MGAQWLSGRVLDSRPKGRGFEPHRRHCVVSLSKNINPSLVLVQPRKTRPFITERLLMGRKESNQTNKDPRLTLTYLTSRSNLLPNAFKWDFFFEKLIFLILLKPKSLFLLDMLKLMRQWL